MLKMNAFEIYRVKQTIINDFFKQIAQRVNISKEMNFTMPNIFQVFLRREDLIHDQLI